MKSNDIKNLDSESKSARIIERMLMDNNLVLKPIKELTQEQMLDFMNICSYAISFNRRYVSNVMMSTMIVIPDYRLVKRFKRNLFQKYRVSKNFSNAQKRYLIQRIINGKKKISENKAISSEIIHYYENTKEKEKIKNSYIKSGIDITNFSHQIYIANGDLSKIENWLSKKTTNTKVLEHFRKVAETSKNNIENINKIVRDMEKKQKIKGVTNKKELSVNISDDEKVLAVISRFKDINNPVFKIIDDEKFPIEKKMMLIYCFAMGDFYNKNSCISSFFINISSRIMERQKSQMLRELIRRYKTSKRYEDLHRYYFQDCLIGGWGEYKKDFIFARLVKELLVKYGSYEPLKILFKEKGINLHNIAKQLEEDDNWKKKYMRIVSGIQDNLLQKSLNKIYRDSQFKIQLIEQDLYCVRKNSGRLYLAGKKGASK